jgi:3-dehydroquinate dehydratase-2
MLTTTPTNWKSSTPTSNAGFALKDCIKGAGLPYVEVHISNIAKRNIHCVMSDVAEGMITGFGIHSYILGLDAMLEILKKRAMGR